MLCLIRDIVGDILLHTYIVVIIKQHVSLEYSLNSYCFAPDDMEEEDGSTLKCQCM